MRTEMDFMRMDEHQRICWLKANRILIFVIGVVWLGIIGWELLQNRVPVFMIVMVPVLALTRLVLYKFYVRRA
ncbi:MAG: hypothetical protein KAW46_00010 [candidate division Zixibacteria bacterium]|nr:hypothetical protein [candidate division Zixibacteria bacterium]